MKHRQGPKFVVRHDLFASVSALAVTLNEIRNKTAAIVRNLTHNIDVLVVRIQRNGHQVCNGLCYGLLTRWVVGIRTQVILVDPLELGINLPHTA